MGDVAVLALFVTALCTSSLVLILHLLSTWFPSLKLISNPAFQASGNGISIVIPFSPLVVLILAPVAATILLPVIGRTIGRYLSFGTAARRKQLVSNSESEERALGGHQPFDEEWETREEEENRRRQDPKVRAAEYAGIVGFFHPFCNAGGGGERVLWAAIRAIQHKYPKAICVVYTGDHDASKADMISRAAQRFNIELNETRIHFLYLGTRKLVLANTWPYFTLLGQSIGSLVLLVDAFTLLVPDIFIDTMGYGFSLALAKWLKPSMPTGAYVHYPTISTDMLATLDDQEELSPRGIGSSAPKALSQEDKTQMVGRRGLNAGAGKGWKGLVKRYYWQAFAWMYSRAGGKVDIVMTNSSWTQGHISSLWSKSRQKNGRTSKIEVVFPPCAVEELEKAITVNEQTEAQRENILVCIAQFRPEKNHELLLHSFATMLKSSSASSAMKESRLVLIGSVRDEEDSKRVYNLRLLANELHIESQVDFITNAPWKEILDWLRHSSVGVNGMWSEHFGIGVVEYQAAGLISVVNDSGGPKLDIVTNVDGQPTGYHASTAGDYADAFHKALQLSPQDKMAMRLRAQVSAMRFSEAEFDTRWLAHLDKLIQLDIYAKKPSGRWIETLMTGLFAVAIANDLGYLLRPAAAKFLGRWLR